MRSKAIKYAAIMWIDARQQLFYRGEFAMRGVSIAMFMLIFVSLWNTVYAIGGQRPMAGYRLSQVIWYLAMTETMVLSVSRVFTEISEGVKSGDVAYTLARPYHYLGYNVAHAMGVKLPIMALNIVVASLVILPFVRRVETSPAGVAGFVVLALVGGLMDAMIAVLMGLAAFWIEDVMPLYWIYNKLLLSVGGMFLPLDLFPGWLRRISDVLPFRFIVYAPARTFVAFEAPFFWRALAGQLGYCLLLCLILAAVWRYGRRRVVVHGG
jgi:ABC-2 type transport system permease protein